MTTTLTLEQYRTIMARRDTPLTDYSMTHWVRKYRPEGDFSIANLSDDLAWDDQEV